MATKTHPSIHPSTHSIIHGNGSIFKPFYPVETTNAQAAWDHCPPSLTQLFPACSGPYTLTVNWPKHPDWCCHPVDIHYHYYCERLKCSASYFIRAKRFDVAATMERGIMQPKREKSRDQRRAQGASKHHYCEISCPWESATRRRRRSSRRRSRGVDPLWIF